MVGKRCLAGSKSCLSGEKKEQDDKLSLRKGADICYQKQGEKSHKGQED